MTYHIFPRPKSVNYTGGEFTAGDIKIICDDSLSAQGYRIALTEREQTVSYADDLGYRYARQTLKQLGLEPGKKFACVIIDDAPAILRRGILLDISRDKIPTRETLFRVADILEGLRINEIQLYIQGYSYEYNGWQDSFPDETPLTKEDLTALRDYAAQRGITLIPNMNCMGHLDMWLNLSELKHFAECPDGFDFQGLYHRAPGTIDPKDDSAFEFVKSLCDDLLDGFPDGLFNANCDEPFELGLGKSREICEKLGKTEVYCEYICRLNEYIKQKGFEMMMWGDVIYARPESVKLLPEDVILLDWIYEGRGRFQRHAKIAAETGRRFYVCPGTSTWCSFLGRSDNMKENIRDAAETAIKYGAYGMMITDWGDLGHWQYLPVSYLGFAFGGAYGWNPETNDDTVFNYLDSNVFDDKSERLARLLYKLGNYYLEEKTEVFNTTESFFLMTRRFSGAGKEALDKELVVLRKKAEHIAEENAIEYAGFSDKLNHKRVCEYLENLCAQLEDIHPNADDGELVIRELKNAARFAAHGAKLHGALSAGGSDISFAELAEDIVEILDEHKELWHARNRFGGYERSTAQLEWLEDFYRGAGA